MFQSNNSLAHPIFPLDSSAQAFYGQHAQQNPGIHNNILNSVMSHSTVDPLETALCQNMGMQLPPLNGFHDGASQVNNSPIYTLIPPLKCLLKKKLFPFFHEFTYFVLFFCNSQFPVAFSEDDLNTIVQMGFVQSGAGKSPSHSQNFNGNKGEKERELLYLLKTSFSLHPRN